MSEQKCPKCGDPDNYRPIGSIAPVKWGVGCSSCGWTFYPSEADLFALALQKHEGAKGEEETDDEAIEFTGGPVPGRTFTATFAGSGVRPELDLTEDPAPPLPAPEGFASLAEMRAAWPEAAERLIREIKESERVTSEDLRMRVTSESGPLPAPLTPEERLLAIIVRRAHATGVAVDTWDGLTDADLFRWDDDSGFVLTPRGQSLLDRLNAEEAKRG